jgi:hypothetical protein
VLYRRSAIRLASWPGSLPFLNRGWPPQSRPADVPVWLRHLMAGHIRTDSGRCDAQESRYVLCGPPVVRERAHMEQGYSSGAVTGTTYARANQVSTRAR